MEDNDFDDALNRLAQSFAALTETQKLLAATIDAAARSGCGLLDELDKVLTTAR